MIPRKTAATEARRPPPPDDDWWYDERCVAMFSLLGSLVLRAHA
jgi:ribosomal protein S19E (S16A)